ncbi:MAG TPA: OmpA family protein [Polyangiaceae bacterium]|nr:OmpA family protein [Polyangiaceae bacterium]
MARADWLPWGLSVFGAACAAFVLVKGVLPARASNAELTRRVARLETAAQRADDERSSLAREKEQLEARYASAAARLTPVERAEERQKNARETARRELSQALAPAIQQGDVALGQRQDELVLELREDLLFHPGHADVTWTGRQFLKNLAQILKRLPGDQVYQIGDHTLDAGSASEHKNAWKLSATRAANVARCLEDEGKLPGPQLIAAGFSRYPRAPTTGGGANTGIEIVLLRARP